MVSVKWNGRLWSVEWIADARVRLRDLDSGATVEVAVAALPRDARARIVRAQENDR